MAAAPPGKARLLRRSCFVEAGTGGQGVEVRQFMAIGAAQHRAVVGTAAMLTGGLEADGVATACRHRVEGGKPLPAGKVQQHVKGLRSQ